MAYESEATRFLNSLLERHPELRELRARNRATWWDRPQPPRDERAAGRVPQRAYEYFPEAARARSPRAD